MEHGGNIFLIFFGNSSASDWDEDDAHRGYEEIGKGHGYGMLFVRWSSRGLFGA